MVAWKWFNGCVEMIQSLCGIFRGKLLRLNNLNSLQKMWNFLRDIKVSGPLLVLQNFYISLLCCIGDRPYFIFLTLWGLPDRIPPSCPQRPAYPCTAQCTQNLNKEIETFLSYIICAVCICRIYAKTRVVSAESTQ